MTAAPVALVTGGTRGIGRAIVEAFAGAGYAVAFCARDPAGVATATAALRAQGIAADGRPLDAADHAALRQWVADTHARFGRLDAVVANASALVEACTVDDWRRSFEIDLLHTVTLAEAAAPLMRPKGAIVAIASMVALEDHGYDLAAYGALKAAIVYYVRSLARHLAPRGIRVNAVSPGVIRCPGGYWELAERELPELWRATMAASPTGRPGTAGEVASTVLYLASDAASFVTGANLVVDGGFSRAM